MGDLPRLSAYCILHMNAHTRTINFYVPAAVIREELDCSWTHVVRTMNMYGGIVTLKWTPSFASFMSFAIVNHTSSASQRYARAYPDHRRRH